MISKRLRWIVLGVLLLLIAAAVFAFYSCRGCSSSSPPPLSQDQQELLEEFRTAGALGEDPALTLGASRALRLEESRVWATPDGKRLFDVNLPAGDSGSINVGWFRNGAQVQDPSAWLAQGYRGVRFVGQGKGVTHLRCSSWDGITVGVGRADLVVRLEALTLHAGYDHGTQFGEQNLARELVPGFRIELVNCEVVVDPPFDYFTRERRFQLQGRGRGYAVGDTLTASSAGELQAATFRVTAVALPGIVESPNDLADGEIRALDLIQVGRYARPPPFAPVALTGGSGEGATALLGQRPKWGLFAYNADLILRDCTLDAREAVEHASYWHGFASGGALVERCMFLGSGAEGFKVRSDALETAYPGREVWIQIRDCIFSGWFQPWTWRGGAAIVLQGTAANVLIERCQFFGGEAIGSTITANNRCHAVMISSESDSYDQETGTVGTGSGNGLVYVRDCLAWGRSEYGWNNAIVRCARNGGSQNSARGFLLERSGVWGPQVVVTVGQLPAGRMIIRDCNGRAVVELGNAAGMPTSPEATYPTAIRGVPLSEGIVR
jgi:hypothetical protein